MSGRAADVIVSRVSAPARTRTAEPKLIVLVLGAAAVMVLCVIAIIETGDIWLAVLTVVALTLLATAIILELRGTIAQDGAQIEVAPPPPDRCIVVSTAPMTAPQVLDALGPEAGSFRKLMFVAPEGLGSGGLMVDEHDYERARRTEANTVAALRKAGINAAGHVGDRNPQHAIEDALALFPAGRVVVMAHGVEADIYREHVDVDRVARSTGAEVLVLEVVGT